ncbi:MAG: GNAT family N-acetyltransferase [Moorea sp. SIO4E2]|uniref:GNAT family N-acetyltransferase n=1 Tax=Moorena sp. SIO4E2 TaxID=2607826 RepID=UPI0013BCE4A8|nr:GNAT family N-acetyltransferase [Moorena sp. SIO4E2]NEQ11446.1 GNAT family N-acetyltransferase [Moorena sp. SIO4E2]
MNFEFPLQAYKIIKRKITEQEAKLLIKEIMSTPKIIGYSLREWMAEDIMVAEDKDCHLVGACLSYNFHKDWTKIAVLFVFEDYRGKGIGKSLLYAAFNDAMERRKNVYTISANSVVIKMMKDLDFLIFDSLFNFPTPYKEYELAFCLHHIKWVINFYRIQEIIRKKIAYPNQQTFVYGFRACF